MKEGACDVLIVGGGAGGCAAALSLANSGLSVILTEPTDWIGGQLTSQAVPPDEHPWIEQFGCTATYRQFRNRVRRFYFEFCPLTAKARNSTFLNPGLGWVSRLCFEPRIAWGVLNGMLDERWGSEQLEIRLLRMPIGLESNLDQIRSVEFLNLKTGNSETIECKFVLDATEMGDLLPLANVEYRIGAESRRQTGEEHAVDGNPEPENVQGITWCFAMAWDPKRNEVIDKPAEYDHWRTFTPPFWAGPLLSLNTIHAHTGEPFTWTLFANEHERNMGLFDYRQIISKETIDHKLIRDTTIVNWPQNDYFEATTLDVDEATLKQRFNDSKQLSRSLLYWLQTEAPRPEGGAGYPGLYLDGDPVGTKDGFAKAPYVRESRRIEALFTVLEQHVSAHDNPDQTKAPPFWDSVGIGAYRIDLHPSANGRPTIDFSSLPFQVPLGSLIPVRMENLLPACKNLGVTHITNGCYRLHPVEWNIGEAAGALAAFCLNKDLTPQQVYASKEHVAEFQAILIRIGVELNWPEVHAL